MRQLNPLVGARCVLEVKCQFVAGTDLDSVLGKLANAQFRPLQIGQNANRAATCFFQRPDKPMAFAVIRVTTVTEIEPEDIDTGVENLGYFRSGRGSRTESGEDLGLAFTVHGTSRVVTGR